MQQLMKFNNALFSLRAVTVNEEPLFLGKDVAKGLDYPDTTHMTRRLDADEYKKLDMRDFERQPALNVGCNSDNPYQIFITESGLYNAILGSKKKEAKEFKRWVTHEVLPSIRKHGAYMTESTLDQIRKDPDCIFEIANALVNEKKRRLQAETRCKALENQTEQNEKEKQALQIRYNQAISDRDEKQLEYNIAQSRVDYLEKRLKKWGRPKSTDERYFMGHENEYLSF